MLRGGGAEAYEALVGYVVVPERADEGYLPAAALHKMLEGDAPAEGVVRVHPVYARVARVAYHYVREFARYKELVDGLRQRAAVDDDAVDGP